MESAIRDLRSAGSEARPGCEVALDVLEFWVRDLRGTAELLIAGFGFRPLSAVVGGGPDEEATCLVCGGVSIVLRQGTTPANPLARHVAIHGDTVADVALTCADPEALLARARRHGLLVAPGHGCERVDVSGDGTIWHSIRRHGLAVADAPSEGGLDMLGVDHVACCLPAGQGRAVAEAYERVFGLVPVDVGDAAVVGDDDVLGMRSQVLRSGAGFTVVLTEPARPGGSGQIERFLAEHRGPGVQHAALAYEDLCGAVTALRDRGVSFLPTPGLYYEQSRERLADHELAWDALRRLEILVDSDDDGLLFQLFTGPIADRRTFFVELIQRSGATSFGANNVRALFAAVQAALDDDAQRSGDRSA